MRQSRGSQRNQTIAAMTMATTSSDPRTYLLVTNHDSDFVAGPENGAEWWEPVRSGAKFVLARVRMSEEEAAEGRAAPAAFIGTEVAM